MSTKPGEDDADASDATSEDRAGDGGKDDRDGSGGSDAGEEGDGGEKEGKPSPLKKPWVRIGLLVVALGLVAAGAVYGWHYWTTGRFMQETDNAYIKADQVTVSPQVSGRIAEIPVSANQTVAAGDLLVRIDDRQSSARVAQARAQLDGRRAEVARTEAEVERQRAQIEQAKAQLAVNRVGARFAGDQVARYRPLAASGADTVERLEQYRSQSDQAKAQVDLGEAQVESARKQLASTQAQLPQARAMVEQAQAELTQAQVDLDHTVIRSPVAGRVGDLNARIGETVQPGTRLMAIVPVEDLYIDANFKETQVGLMRIGQPVKIEVDALPDRPLNGRLASFSPGTGARFALIPPQNATGNFTKIVQRVPVRIRFKSGQEARKVLVPGLSVVVTVDTRSARQDEEDEEEAAPKQTSDAGPGDARGR